MLNYSVRPVYWAHKENGQGLCPIKICVTINRARTYLATPFKVKPAQWDESTKEVTGHPNRSAINAAIRKQMAEIEQGIISRQLKGVAITKKSLRAEPGKTKSVAEFAREVRADERELNRLKAFSPDLQLEDISPDLLRKFEAHERRRGMAPNTINSTFKYFRRIINQAHREGLLKDNPFDSYQVPRYQQTDRVYLVQEELKALINLFKKPLPDSLYDLLCYYLLGCYSGLRHSDWLRFDPDKMVHDGFLRLRAKKNKTFVVLPIGPTLGGIIERIRAAGRRPVSNQKCNEKLKSLFVLANIKKNGTTHSARHSFGYLCASNRLPKSVTAELMGISTQTVEVYYHLSGQDIADQAAALRTL